MLERDLEAICGRANKFWISDMHPNKFGFLNELRGHKFVTVI